MCFSQVCVCGKLGCCGNIVGSGVQKRCEDIVPTAAIQTGELRQLALVPSHVAIEDVQALIGVRYGGLYRHFTLLSWAEHTATRDAYRPTRLEVYYPAKG